MCISRELKFPVWYPSGLSVSFLFIEKEITHVSFSSYINIQYKCFLLDYSECSFLSNITVMQDIIILHTVHMHHDGLFGNTGRRIEFSPSINPNTHHYGIIRTAQRMFSSLFINGKDTQKRGLALNFSNAFSKSTDIMENSILLNMHCPTDVEVQC